MPKLVFNFYEMDPWQAQGRMPKTQKVNPRVVQFANQIAK